MCLNYEYPPMGGGAGNATRHTAIELSRRGHTVHVLTSRLPQQPDVETEGKLVVYRVFSHRQSIHQAGLLGGLTYLFGAFARLRRLSHSEDYDVFHFYFGLPTGLLALYVRLVLKKPYIIALRGSDVPGYDNTRHYLRYLHGFLNPLTRYIWKGASAVTALSQHLKALANTAVPNVDIAVINNGVNTELFPSLPKKTTSVGPVRLLCVCRLIRRKGLEYLLTAMCHLKKQGVTLQIVGTGERAAQIQELVRSLDLEDHVDLVGYVPRERLVDYYNRADIFVLPSLSESFGQVLLEAMSSGLPVIASKVGGIPETIHEGKGGLLTEPANSEAIVGAVLSLARQPKLRDAMAEYNRRQVDAYYGWAAVAEQYEQLYRDCLLEADREVCSGT